MGFGSIRATEWGSHCRVGSHISHTFYISHMKHKVLLFISNSLKSSQSLHEPPSKKPAEVGIVAGCHC